MGLGKTLTILSLIVGSLEEARGIAYSQRSNSGSAPINSGATLLIAPIGSKFHVKIRKFQGVP